MDELKLGGFPPLIKKVESKIKTDQKELKPQFFSQIQRQNINIREILSKKTTIFDNTKDEKLEEVDSV